MAAKKKTTDSKPAAKTSKAATRKQVMAMLSKLLKDDPAIRPMIGSLLATSTPAKIVAKGKGPPPRPGIKSASNRPPVADILAPNSMRETYTVTLEGYAHQHAATADAAQLLKPGSVAYRSAVFPAPAGYGINVRVIKADPVQVKDAHPLNPWGVELTLELVGHKTKRAEWLARFEDTSRMFRNAAKLTQASA